ncbi:MAG TPA: ATP-dependent DNA ligase [Verrucomicrobiae bacterium]|nr:ATP-dependent DNA ligase [Verrucomicrobiae bacterium]
MSVLTPQGQTGSIVLPQLNLWLDPHWPRTGPEKVFVSHAHSDHVAAHREVILSAPTSRLMQARLPGQRREHVLAFGETRSFGAFEMRLIPAGHIFGSAMACISAGGETLLYSGDFKLRPGLSAECCEPCRADILIMETTFGRPQYRFPPTAEVLRGIVRFCQEALDNDETPVLLGYSLGKSQELLCGLAEAGFKMSLHGSAYKLTKVYEQLGQKFPAYERYEAGNTHGKVLVCPPSVVGSAMLRNLGRARTAVLTGWAADPNCRYRYGVDAAFPLSDHADFPDLLEFVKRVGPKIVYTVHGFATEFAQTLRDHGYDARALGIAEQMGFGLREPALSRKRSTPVMLREKAEIGYSEALFVRFAETCAAIATTSSKLEKIRVLAAYLRTVPEQHLPDVAIWFTGTPFAPVENKVLQLGWAVLRDALCAIANIDDEGFHQIYLRHSDLGETAHDIIRMHAAVEPRLTLTRVKRLFEDLHVARGKGKLPIFKAALEECTTIEAKYLVKVVTGDLRIGLKEGLVEEAIAQAFDVNADAVRQANLLRGHIGETAVLAKQNRLADASLVPFRPVKFMLASPEPTAEDIWNRLQSQTVWLEDKYDGIRCQLHKVGGRVELYSRDLKDITRTFFDIVDAAKTFPVDLILDGELLAMRGERALAFSELQKRLGRRESDLFLGAEVPIIYMAFDLLWLNGESLLLQPLAERRRALEGLLPFPEKFRLAPIAQAASAEQIETAFTAARERNNEGLMVKDPASAYTPGRRGLSWLKLKKAYATLDCVVIGAEYGHGKRKDVLSDYTFAVRDERTNKLATIGKAYTGLTDVEIGDLTKHFLKTAIRQHGRYFEVEPEIVLEIAFDRIQPSDRHSSGLAMRFPRILRIRTDKTPADIDTLAAARALVRE